VKDVEFPEYVRDMDGRTGEVTGRFPEYGKFNVEWFDGSGSTERLTGDGRNWTALISRKTATECLDAVRKWTRDDTATLYDPGFHADGWVIALEGGSYEWPILITQDESVVWPDGVKVEALNHWALSLYTG
jgi:hypothetical protein